MGSSCKDSLIIVIFNAKAAMKKSHLIQTVYHIEGCIEMVFVTEICFTEFYNYLLLKKTKCKQLEYDKWMART